MKRTTVRVLENVLESQKERKFLVILSEHITLLVGFFNNL